MKIKNVRKLSHYLTRYPDRALVLLLMVLSIPIGVLLVLNPGRPDVGAAPGNAIIFVKPQSQSSQVGEQKQLEIWIDPQGESVGSVQLIMTYDPNVILADAIVPGSFFTSMEGQLGSTVQVLKNLSTPGRIEYAIGFMLGSNFGSSASGPVAVLTYTAVANGTSPVNFIVNEVVNTKANDVNGVNVLGTVSSGEVVVGASTSTGTRLWLSPAVPADPQAVSRVFATSINLDTLQAVDAVDAILTFDPKVVSAQRVVQATGTPFTSFPQLSFDNSTGRIYVSANIGTGTSSVAVTGSGVAVATIEFSPKAEAASSTVAFVFTPVSSNDSNVVLHQTVLGADPVDILESVSNLSFSVGVSASPTPTPAPASPTPTPTPAPASPTPTPTPTPAPASPTPTPTPGAAQTMTIKYSLQGRSRGVNLPVVTVRYIIQSLSGAKQEGYLKSNASSELQVSLVPGDYRVWLDVPGYLGRVFGTTASPVRIVEGTNYLDLSNTIILGGDFNNDGEVNEIDYTLNFLPNFRSTNTKIDLDASGEVNNLDYGIMRNTWGMTEDLL